MNELKKVNPRSKKKLLFAKIISFLSVIRIYNLLVIIVAQYLSVIFILAPGKKALSILLDQNVFLIVLASSITIASGYIINNFYDREKDFINRPNKSILDRLVSKSTKLKVYFSLNFIAALLAFLASWQSFLFFSAYIFIIWFYSHKIKKHPIVGNLTAAVMAIIPFFALLLHYYVNVRFEELETYKNHLFVVFYHAVFLFLLLLIREMIKDLENIKGDFANNYQTIPIRFGEKVSKKIISILVFLTIIPVYFLVDIYDVGYMDIYFYGCFIFLIFILQYLWKSNKKEQYLILHNVLKILIILGVLSIILINPEVIIHGKVFFFKK